MKLDRPALSVAAGFFLIWLCVLYLGADHPPPRGFVWIVVLDLVAALSVYLRIPAYADWHAARRPHRVLRVLGDGALAGLAVGTATLILAVARPVGAVTLGWEAVVVWLVLLTLVGAINTVLLYVVISRGRAKGLDLAKRNPGDFLTR